MCIRDSPYIKGCNSDASQQILWKQVVPCSALSRKHFKTSLADYCGGGRVGGGGGGGCTVGQVSFQTTTQVHRLVRFGVGELLG